ncbi:MAG: hypothetical protein ACRDRX_15400 [Pseudonocardiaceae bacterium]
MGLIIAFLVLWLALAIVGFFVKALSPLPSSRRFAAVPVEATQWVQSWRIRLCAALSVI